MLEQNSNNKSVLISGISSGIGEGMLQKFLEEDWIVYGFSRREPKTKHDNLRFASIDLNSDEASLEINKLLEGCVQLDLAVLNAGVLGDFKNLEDHSLNDLKSVMNVNLWSQQMLLQTLFKSQISIKRVIGLSSGAAVNGNKGWGGYSLSKAAFNMLIKLYASEKNETHFLAMAPGLVDTAMQNVICDEVSAEEFPSVGRIQQNRGTANMPMPYEFASKFYDQLGRLEEFGSGSFVDLRHIRQAQ
jgi:benzil reductase ((S)-benzoin forming)